MRSLLARLIPGKDQWSSSTRRAWLDFSVQSGVAAVNAQREELSGIRNRSLTFTAFIVAACGLLVGVGLNQRDRPPAFFIVAVIGTALFAALAVLLILIVVPLFKFKFILEPDMLLRWQSGDSPAPSYDEARQALIIHTLAPMLDHNKKQLTTVRRLYLALLVTAFCTLGVWVGLVWVFA